MGKYYPMNQPSHNQSGVALVSQHAKSERRISMLVLASGGIDSSTLLALSVQKGLGPVALFVDFGQPAAEAESRAMANICSWLNISWRHVRYAGSRFHAGEIRGRNAFLLQAALLEFPSDSGIVVFGIHTGTEYADCSPEFMQIMGRSYGLQTGGTIVAVAPFLDWTKPDVYRLANELGVPIARTYSCEASNSPCGRCNSCKDRRLLDAGVV